MPPLSIAKNDTHLPVDTARHAENMPENDISPEECRNNQSLEDKNGDLEESMPQEKPFLTIKSSTCSHHSRTGADGNAFLHHDKEADYPVDVERPATDDTKEIIVTWDGDDDPMSPKSMGLPRKWAIVLILSASSLCVTCASAMYTSTYSQIEQEFGCSREVATLGLSLFVIGLGTGPLVLSPLSEVWVK